jgi:NAD(P)-dependent dehydrogenase (short-subunit alcohol dehydrogenase family)
MSYDYANKVVAVMGGSGALGGAIVEAYIAAGVQVVVGDRTIVKAAEKGDNPARLKVDVLSEESVKGFLATIEKDFGTLNALVNVVGGYKAGEPVSKTNLEDLEGQFDLNLKTAFIITKHTVQALEKAGGSILHISSRAAVDKGKNSFAYSASKLGVLRLVEAVAEEVKKNNITINAVLPSIIDTPANRKAMPDADVDKWPKPEQIAKVVLFLTSPDAELISGAAIPVYGKA